jgi:hypothetical protein
MHRLGVEANKTFQLPHALMRNDVSSTVQAARESWGIAGALLYNGESDPPFSPAPQPEISPAEIWAAEMPPEIRSQTREIRLPACTARVLPVFVAYAH